MSEEFSRVKFNHETAEQETERKRLKKGQHFVIVSAATRQLSKEKEETQKAVRYKMIVATVKPVRDPNDITTVVGKGINDYWCLPFWDENWDDLDFDVDTKDGPMHVKKYLDRNITIYMESVRDRLAALMPNEVPARPFRANVDSPYMYKGEEIESDQYKACNTESKAAAGEVAEQLWNDGPETLVDKGCYVLIGYEENSQYPNSPRIIAWSATPMMDRKTGEELPVYYGEMEAPGGAATEEESAAEEKPVKANGAKGKPSASAKTVAAAAASKKGKSTSKGARR